MNINGKWYTEPQTIAYVNKMDAKISDMVKVDQYIKGTKG